MGVAQNIYRLRGEAGWTQAELAEKLGVARPTVAQWENGWTSPRMGMVQRLAGVFGVSTEAIVTETPEPGMADLAAVWRTYMRWELGVPEDMLEKMMGHAGRGVGERHYDRPEEDAFVRAVASAWAALRDR